MIPSSVPTILGRGARAAALACALAAAPASAQILTGRVLEEGTSRPVPGAAVSLSTEGGAHRAGAITDSLGRFRLAPPEEGEYVVSAERLGYEATRSPVFALGLEGEVPFEILMRPLPVGLEGFEVTVEREAEELLGIFGLTPGRLGNRWIDRGDIEALPAPAGPREIIHWQSIAGLWAYEDGQPQGLSELCVAFRRGRTALGNDRCALVLVDGILVPSNEAQALSPEEIESIAILTPVEATTFYGTEAGGGAVLIWTRRPGR